ncbi:MAG: TM2 domain-containing protein [Oscillospiraceae bacterium]|nr:TM2 domain-containing protein [Oscillospiraceae bacterium]
MSYCTVCGTEVISNFCPKCGKAATQFSAEDNRYTSQKEQYPRYTKETYYSYYDPPINNPYSHNYANNRRVPVSRKSRLVALLLCIFVGCFGVHHFYVGRIGYGILFIFTGGLFGIGLLVDFILILTGSYKDEFGFFVSDWNA